MEDTLDEEGAQTPDLELAFLLSGDTEISTRLGFAHRMQEATGKSEIYR